MIPHAFNTLPLIFKWGPYFTGAANSEKSPTDNVAAARNDVILLMALLLLLPLISVILLAVGNRGENEKPYELVKPISITTHKDRVKYR